MSSIFQELERGDVTLNYNGDLLQYGYVVFHDRLVIHCCQRTLEIPADGPELCRHSIREHVLSAIEGFKLNPCRGEK